MKLKHIIYATIFLLAFSIEANADTIPEKNGQVASKINPIYKVVKSFSQVDTNYIEPQHYNFAVMLQNTNTYESYTFKNLRGQSITLAPEPTYRVGPYFGWRWIFLGYTLDISHLHSRNKKKEFDISLYSNKIGIDLYYRKTGNDYKIQKMLLGTGFDNSKMNKVPFTGFEGNIKGFNIYYIFNHRKFSYPAAFSQSTVQRRSAGSPLIGIGYTRQKASLDVTELNKTIASRLGKDNTSLLTDSTWLFSKVHYTDIAVSGGYAYNWVFAHNWVFASSLSLALGYKTSTADSQKKAWTIRDFDFKNINLDGVGRFGIVWNNTKWFAGASAIFHTYNYRKDQFHMNTLFGNLNFYVGFNFDRR